ncbi:hypothetical protein LTR37_014272 [Vermiconidia calcicola]|uniref:Uncharacterized protein n=1 Tax=Vermiconidia calcicola TaxID=1690605 RepID=A0ACC3MU46_9PEZI|nr:hypothetical protein LTR37_014272 [Vermiconidia calcicola]
MPGSESPLLSLSNELLDHIVSYLPNADLRTLRLVSKDVGERTERRVGHACYSNLNAAFWLPYSLWKVRSVLQHWVLSAYVCTITIHVDRPVLADRDEVRHCSTGCSQCDDLKGEYGTFIFECFKARKLDRWELLPAVAIRDKEQDEKVVSPLRQLEDTFGNLVSYLPNTDASATVRTIFDAMSAATLQPGNMCIGGRTFGIPVKMFRPPSVFDVQADYFSRITSLYLYIQATPQAEDLPTQAEDAKHLVTFLKSLRHRLTRFCFCTQVNGFESDTATATVYSMEMAFKALYEDDVVFTKLIDLTLRFLIVDQRKLINFLARHKDTLRTYALPYVYLAGPEVDLAEDQWKERFLEHLRTAGLPPADCTDTMSTWKRPLPI